MTFVHINMKPLNPNCKLVTIHWSFSIFLYCLFADLKFKI